jgi:copper chaperone
MITFQVNDMTCGHCVSTITKAVKAEDKDAKVQVDLATHRVVIESVTATAQELQNAIAEAGYAPVYVESAASPGAAPVRKGCCCS